MSLQSYQWIFLALMALLANWPFLTQRCCLVLECARKPVWLRLLEWCGLYVVVSALGFLLEQRLMGASHEQDWEFYIVTFFLFMVFAFPGFVYRYVR